MRPSILVLVFVALGACTGDQKPTPGDISAAAPVRDSQAGTVTTGPAKPDTARGTTQTASKAASNSDTTPSAKAGPDSAIILAEASQPEHRTTRDSISLVASIRAGLKSGKWPVRMPAPLPGSLLPQKRIVAFYGNTLSKKMGVLGEYPQPVMLAKLDTIVAEWTKADPSTPVQPALHLIVSVAQADPGKDSMYRQRSDTGLIEKVYGWAKSKNAVMFLDIQTGKSTVEAEVQRLLPFLARPDVHLGLDPEFNMHHNREGRRPGSKIGAMTADEVNYAIDQLAQLVTKYNLPPKVLIVHRFTVNMLQDASKIKLDPRVQVVINMDGWGEPWLKFDTYKTCEVEEPVQFTGFKLFFHNDVKKGERLLTASEVLALRPRPLYIQYQ